MSSPGVLALVVSGVFAAGLWGDLKHWGPFEPFSAGASQAPAATLPANPQYYISAANDFEQGATDGEAIGASREVCSVPGSLTDECLTQTSAANRGTWQQASDCAGSMPCWKWDANDFMTGNTSTSAPSDWYWLGQEPFIAHMTFKFDAVVTGLAAISGNKSTSGSSKGLYVFVDNRSSKRDLLLELGGTPNTGITGTNCLLGVDETAPHIVTVELLGLGTNEFRVSVDGAVCAQVTASAYADNATTRFALPYVNATSMAAGEGYFYWADTETSAGSVAAMQARAATALTILAGQLGVSLP